MGVEILESPHKNWTECYLNPSKLDLVRRYICVYMYDCAYAMLPSCIAALEDMS